MQVDPEGAVLPRAQISDGLIPLKEVEQGAQRLAARAVKVGVFRQDELAIVPRGGQQVAMDRQVGDPQGR